jgi:hypothetical protein
MWGTHYAYKRFLCQMEPEVDDVTPGRTRRASLVEDAMTSLKSNRGRNQDKARVTGARALIR